MENRLVRTLKKKIMKLEEELRGMRRWERNYQVMVDQLDRIVRQRDKLMGKRHAKHT